MNDMKELENLIKLNEYAYGAVYNFRRQYYYAGWNKCAVFVEKLNDCLNIIISTLGERIVDEMEIKNFFAAMESQDEILVADIIEGCIIPVVEKLVRVLQSNFIENDYNYLEGNIDALDKCGKGKYIYTIKKSTPRCNVDYIFENTASGYPTIKLEDGEKSYYINGNNNPYIDAFIFATGNMDDNIYKYSILGIGLCFEVRAMLELREDIEVEIVEEDPYLMRLAMTYVDLEDLIADDRVQFRVQKYSDYIAETELYDRKVLARKASIKHLSDAREADVLSRFFMNSMSLSEQKYMLDRNYRRNMQLGDIRCIDECEDDFRQKEIYLVAGGPSLNYTMDRLVNRSTDSVVLCVGTSLKKLMSEDIVPDYVIITDAKDNMYYQLHDVIDPSKTKLLYMSTANYKAVEDFAGERYMICQKGMPEAEEYAENHGYKTFNTGGSVTTTAVDICIQFGCKVVWCMGMDMAYTDEKTHADGTMGVKKIANSTNMMKVVEGVKGDLLYTSENLHSYHVWIEHRIENVKDIKFINISNGAYIKGMENVPTT